MLSGKDLLSQFKSATWKGPEEVEAFVAAAEAPPAPDLLRLLEVLSGKPPEAALHRTRLGIFARLAEKTSDKQLFVPFSRALRGGDPGLRSCLAQLLPKVNSPTEHAELCAHLRSTDAPLRQLSARVLTQIGGGRTVFELLGKALGEEEYPGRLEAMEVLVSFAKAQAIPALQAALTVGSVPERVQALKYLGDGKAMQKDLPGALKAMVPVLEAHATEAPPVIQQAIISFSGLCSEDDYWEYLGPFFESPAHGLVKPVVEGLRRFRSPRAIAALERRLLAGPRLIRVAVLNTLEAIGTDEVLPPLALALGHKQLPVRNRAGEVLQKLSLDGKLDVGRTIIWLLRSRDVNVRRMAAEIVRSVADPEKLLWPKLLSLLRDEDWWVRERVMDALIELGGNQLTAQMVNLLADGSDVIRRFAVNVLARLKDPKALRALVHVATNDTDWWVKETAIEAIATINDARAVPYVVHLMHADPELTAVCLQGLIDMDAGSCAEEVAPLTRSENPDVGLLAIRYLDKFDASVHAPLVAALGEDPNPRVRVKAREVMLRWRVTGSGRGVVLRKLDELLLQLAQQEGDDLIVAPGRPVYLKRMGLVTPLGPTVLSEADARSLLLPALSAGQQHELERLRDIDYSHEIKSEGLRFRANIFNQLGGIGGVFRRIKGELPQIEKLGLPPLIKNLGDLKNGLVLVGGPTGSGKSTTLAALIDYINRTQSRHIICLEDPIEVIHQRKRSLVNQREIGTHTKGFAQALRSTLREDPDVILVGEIRDLATIEFTVIAAETGHLVFGTVHTASASTSVDRLIGAFSPGQQEQVRATLADSLRAVICQYLFKEKNGPGRVLAVEIMLNNEAVANLIRKGKAFQIPSVISTSRELGMQLMDTDLLRLLKEGRISAEDAYVKAVSKKDFEPFMAGPVQ